MTARWRVQRDGDQWQARPISGNCGQDCQCGFFDTHAEAIERADEQTRVSESPTLATHECETDTTTDADGREYLYPCRHPEHEATP